MKAVRTRNYAIVKLLVDRGAKLSIVDKVRILEMWGSI